MRVNWTVNSRAVRLGAGFGAALALTLAGPAAASPAARSVPSAPASCTKEGITWQNNHNGRYLEVYHSDSNPGQNVDAYTWNCTPTQMWYAIDDGVEYFGYPVGASYDTWSFDNANSGYCLQDSSGAFVRAYTELCSYGDQQEFAEFGSSSGYFLITETADEVCEHWQNNVDWAYMEGNGYVDWGSDHCLWH